MNISSQQWPPLALAVSYLLIAVIHFIAALMLIIIYGAFGWVGIFSYAILISTIPLDVVAAILSVSLQIAPSRHSRYSCCVESVGHTGWHTRCAKHAWLAHRQSAPFSAATIA